MYILCFLNMSYLHCVHKQTNKKKQKTNKKKRHKKRNLLKNVVYEELNIS